MTGRHYVMKKSRRIAGKRPENIKGWQNIKETREKHSARVSRKKDKK